MLKHEIRKGDEIILTGKLGQTLLPFFTERCKAKKGVVRWGHHYRAGMKRRTDPENVIVKCKETGEVLIDLCI